MDEQARGEVLLRLENIDKSFPGVQALQNVSMDVRPGEIHGLLGENGAGKSTLMKVLNGVYSADSGQIYWNEQPVDIHSPHDAQMLGISMIHQELALVSYLDAGKNIFLGREPAGRIPGTVNWGKMYSDAHKIIAELGLQIDVRRPVRLYSLAQQQMIEVARALSMDARLLIMDEPTSSLTDREVETLFDQMRALRERGVSIIFISHRLEEIFQVCDRVTVLRDGEWVATSRIEELDNETLIKQMVGREVTQIYERREEQPEEQIILSIRNLSRGPLVRDVSFDLHRGEVLGITGLVGAGRTELVETIFGAHPATAGEIYFQGEPVTIRRPDQAIRLGIGFVTEDRKSKGLFPALDVAANITITQLKKLVRLVLLNWPKVHEVANDLVKRLDIRTPSVRQRVANLSGGNQQKVIIARWLTLDPVILLLDEPTRGIDVGAKSEIYRLIQRLAARGVSMIVVSSELPEILGISDRILVMHEGHIAGEFDPRQATQDDLMRAATGTYQETYR